MSADRAAGGPTGRDLDGVPGRWTLLQNEFAAVHLVVDEQANGPRLVVLDPTSGRQVSLDPLELQALAWTRHEQLGELLAPAFKETYLHRVDPAALAAGADLPDDVTLDVEDR